jgi:hypothetical protein
MEPLGNYLYLNANVTFNSTISTSKDSIGDLTVSFYVVGVWFCVTVFICYICSRSCFEGRCRNNEAANNVDTANNARITLETLTQDPVVKEAHLLKIGEFVYCQTDHKHEDTERSVTDCPICLISFLPDDKCRKLPNPCCHIFHKACIDQWFSQSIDCPLCKRSVIRLLLDETPKHTVHSEAQETR